jgi:hypothetical protein
MLPDVSTAEELLQKTNALADSVWERIEFFDKSYQESSLKNDPNTVITSL